VVIRYILYKFVEDILLSLIKGIETMSAYNAYSDQELMTLLKEGDHVAYTEIYKRYFKLLFKHAFSRLKNEDESKDVVQELFTNLWYKHNLLKPDRNISNYLYTAVRNRIFDLISRKNLESKYIADLPASIDTAECITDYAVRESQLRQLINREIEALPPKMREVFQLSRNESLSHKEIAEKLDLTEQSVRSHIKNALKILRVKLGLFTWLICLLKL
jgi:RNA polymerase sigma-70 factor (family 1)